MLFPVSAQVLTTAKGRVLYCPYVDYVLDDNIDQTVTEAKCDKAYSDYFLKQRREISE